MHGRLRAAVNQLNVRRAQNGRGPLSSEALLQLLTDRDYTADDFQTLLQLDEDTLSVGATEEEIGRCPDRVIEGAGDELVLGGPDGMAQNCTICIHPFQVGERVRTIQCFHSFHVDCIDPWLARKPECPICKQHAIPAARHGAESV